MTPDETGDLLELLAAANVLNRLEERTPDVWHAALGDLDYRDCMRAAAELIRTQQWVKIADIRNGVMKSRGDNARDIQGPGLPAEVPDADPDDVHAYLAALRQQRTRAADGLELKPRPMKALLASTGREVPDENSAVRGPLGVDCPHCHAKPLHACRSYGGKRLALFHPSRIDAANGAPVTNADEEIARRKAASAAALAALPPTTTDVEES